MCVAAAGPERPPLSTDTGTLDRGECYGEGNMMTRVLYLVLLWGVGGLAFPQLEPTEESATEKVT